MKLLDLNNDILRELMIVLLRKNYKSFKSMSLTCKRLNYIAKELEITITADTFDEFKIELEKMYKSKCYYSICLPSNIIIKRVSDEERPNTRKFKDDFKTYLDSVKSIVRVNLVNNEERVNHLEHCFPEGTVFSRWSLEDSLGFDWVISHQCWIHDSYYKREFVDSIADDSSEDDWDTGYIGGIRDFCDYNDSDWYSM